MQKTGFWDRLAKRYAKMPVGDEESYQVKLSKTQEFLHSQMDVLEFACGTGSTAIIQAPHVNNYLAIDFSAKMIEIAREKAGAAKLVNLKFEQADFLQFEAAENSYDLIMGHSILHLMDDVPLVLDKVCHLLKPGGLFISSTTCLSDNMNLLRPVAFVGRLTGLMPKLNFFTVAQLVDFINLAGMTIEHQWQPGKGKAVFVVARNAMAK